MTAVLTRNWDQRYEDFEKQSILKSQLCRPLVDKFLSPKFKELPSPLGFTLEQYRAAYKTLVLAIALFSPEEKLTLTQLEQCRDEIVVSRISMKLMWQDLCKSKAQDPAEEEKFLAICQLADEILKVLNQQLPAPPSQ
jgi:hypothetical protein